jgi:hypothetical protein
MQMTGDQGERAVHSDAGTLNVTRMWNYCLSVTDNCETGQGAGIFQFINIGPGFPAQGNIRKPARSCAAGARVAIGVV